MGNDFLPSSLIAPSFRLLPSPTGLTWRTREATPTFSAALAQAQREDAAAGQAAAVHDPAKVREASREMEAVFLNLLWREMWRTVNGGQLSFLPKGVAGDIYQDLLTQAYAETMAEAGGIGLGRMIQSHLD
ncbi:MAG: rod-binding protein [Betaproteobacteria bacterium]